MSSTQFYFHGEENRFQAFINSFQTDQVIVLADANSNGFCLPVLKQYCSIFKSYSTIVIPQGEQAKNLETCTFIWDKLIELNATRNSLLVLLGGGVVTDIGGFAASIFKRGIRFINIPTTLLSMVDASYGGKTGIDYHSIKNHLGTFCNAEAIYINPNFLTTLDNRKVKSGIAETIKHVLISSAPLWNEIQSYNEDNFININTIRKSIDIKINLVTQDPFDEGVRQVLNFGHTIGHAIESYSLTTNSPLLHGEAVMLGMLYELNICHSKFNFPIQVIHEFKFLLDKFFPHLSNTYSFNELKPYLQQDKKNNNGIRMSLLRAIAMPALQTLVSESEITSSLQS